MKLHKTFGSDRQSIRFVEPMLLQIREQANFDDAKFYNIVVAVTEAVNNAIHHGNCCDPDVHVDLDIELTDKYLTVSVKDRGDGFDHNALADPRNKENLLKERGRGVFLIKELADEVHYDVSDKGTFVQMIFSVE